MPDIRVTCPTCKTQLEIDAVHEGEEVECGNCLQVFVATAKKPSESGGGRTRGGASRSRNDEDDRPRRRRRRDDDDDDYDDDEYYDRPRRRQSNGTAVVSLVLGIVSVLSLLGSCVLGAADRVSMATACCAVLLTLGASIGAIITGVIGMKNPEGKGMAVTGLVLGILTLVVVLVQFIIGFIIGFAGAVNNNPPPNKFR